MTQITFEQSLNSVAELVKQFRRNAAAYRGPTYKEAQSRRDLIDPFFEALGWDVRNRSHKAPQYCDVVYEPSIDVEGVRKAPDYAFRVGRDVKFYVEAKKPGVALRTNAAAAYQLRAYAWNVKLPLSVLTDFDEWVVYDCRAKPSLADKPSVGRVAYHTFEEYPDCWRELWDTFSYEAVWSGAFDQFAQTSKGKRGMGAAHEVDTEFLKEIEDWRDKLAHNLALRNPRLSVDELNDAVQRTIDRIIFLRMAEDRGIEEYERLLRLVEGEDIYPALIDLCRQADAKYNAGLFNLRADKLTPKLAVDDKVLRPILADMYYPQSPYRFDLLPTEILGNIYEQFLGKVIRLTPSHQAKVEEKPEVKKAGGVYYTPAYIVAYIVKNTVGKWIEDNVGAIRARAVRVRAVREPPQQRDSPLPDTFRVLDPACGSGSFLLGAYQYLLDYYLQWYTDHNPEKHPKAVWAVRVRAVREPPQQRDSASPSPADGGGQGGGWRLTTAEKKRILTSHIFGVDIDRQAVEVTKLSLLLKVLEGESDETLGQQLELFQERALPNLDANIKCGNSLIGPDYFTGQLLPDEGELRRVNPFDWAREFPLTSPPPTSGRGRPSPHLAGEGSTPSPRPRGEQEGGGGFDCIIGNPPYIRMETFRELKSYLKANYASHDERSDLYAYFIERAHKLLNKHGRFGMIVSNKFLRANYGKPLRDFLHHNVTIEHIVDFAGLPVFAGATVRTIVLLTSHEPSGDGTTLYTPPLPVATFEAVASGSLSIEKAIAETTYQVAHETLAQSVWSFAKQETGDLMGRLQASCVPLAQYCDGQICRGVVSGLTKAFVIDEPTRNAILKRNRKAAEIIKPFLNGRDVRRYNIEYKDIYLIYTYHGVDISQYPAIENHLKEYRDKLQKRATRQAWYELQQPQYNFASFMDGPKIIFPDIATTPCFALDDTGYYSSNTTYFIPRRDLYLLGLLNSSLGHLYFVKTCAGLEGKNETYLRFFGQYLEGFPVRPINPSDPADVARHDRMVGLVEQMLELHNRQAAAPERDRELYQRQIEATDKEIDKLVYELYGLTDEEIRIVEEGAR